MVKTIMPNQLKKALDAHEKILIVDVREQWEIEIASISSSVNVPLIQLAQSLHKIEKNYSIVTVCHHGVRSLQAAKILEQNGIQNVASLEGGIDLWSLEVDSSITRY